MCFQQQPMQAALPVREGSCCQLGKCWGVGVCMEGGSREASPAVESGGHTLLLGLCVSGVPFPERSRLNVFTSASRRGSARHGGQPPELTPLASIWLSPWESHRGIR